MGNNEQNQRNMLFLYLLMFFCLIFTIQTRFRKLPSFEESWLRFEWKSYHNSHITVDSCQCQPWIWNGGGGWLRLKGAFVVLTSLTSHWQIQTCTYSYYGVLQAPWPPPWGDSHMKRLGMFVVSLRGINQEFWSHLGWWWQTPLFLAVKVSFRPGCTPRIDNREIKLDVTWSYVKQQKDTFTVCL